MEQKIKDLLRDVKIELRKIYGDKLDRIILFGSYVREDYDNESDIDVLVLVNDSRLEKYDDLILDMIVELTGIYGIFVSIVAKSKTEYYLKRATSPLFLNIEREGQEIYAA
jgi:predicted nucleotidyltransferase